jgi:hypothetical protein
VESPGRPVLPDGAASAPRLADAMAALAERRAGDVDLEELD